MAALASSPGTRARATAPGKLMLFGEHAVVYGRPCLVTTVGLYVSVTAAPAEDGRVTIATPALRARGGERRILRAELGCALEPETAFVEAAAARVLGAEGLPGGLRIETDGPPLSYGLGSSSAVTAAAAAAVAAAAGVELSRRALFDCAYAAVLDAQGKGSGFDVAAAVYGGTLWFEMGGRAIELLEVPELPLRIGYSGAKVSTRRFVDGVERLRGRSGGPVERIFDLMGEIVAEARPAIERGEWDRVGDLADISHGLLDAIGVSTPPLARLVFAAREAGALGAKLSGAGGGDCMFAVAPGERRGSVDLALGGAGLLVDLPLGVPGVQVEHL